MSSMLLDVIGDWFVLLLASAKIVRNDRLSNTDRVDLDDCLCLEQLSWWSCLPFLVSIGEFEVCQMPTDTRHCHGAMTPLCKVEVELIVLDIGVTTDCSLATDQQRPRRDRGEIQL